MRRTLILPVAGLLMFSSGCASRRVHADPDPSIRLEYDTRHVAVGDLVMVNAITEGVADPDAYIEWAAAPAHIRTQDSGRTAFLTYKSPGTYTVTARLIVHERTEREKRITFDVEPGRWPRPGRQATAGHD